MPSSRPSRGTADHYQQSSVVVPQATRRFALLYSAVVYLSLFGALGGLLGWGFGEIFNFRPDPQREAATLIGDYQQIVSNAKKIQATDEEIATKTKRLRDRGESNPYFAIYVNDKLTEQQKTEATARQLDQDQAKNFIARLMFYGVSGVMIAMLLAMADSIVERNLNGAIIYGSIGAVLGLAGGLAVALIVNRIQADPAQQQQLQSLQERVLTQVICWGVLGLFLSAAPGLILRNGKRLLIGMVGGVIGRRHRRAGVRAPAGCAGQRAYQPADSHHADRVRGRACLRDHRKRREIRLAESRFRPHRPASNSCSTATRRSSVPTRCRTYTSSTTLKSAGGTLACTSSAMAMKSRTYPSAHRHTSTARPLIVSGSSRATRCRVGRTKFHFQEKAKSV